MKNIIYGLVAGRHNVPASNFIFDSIDNVLDFNALEKSAMSVLYPIVKDIAPTSFITMDSDGCECYSKEKYRANLVVYVTGLSSALIALLNVCRQLSIKVQLMHYDTTTASYSCQNVY
jgi:hypothetical protein